MIRTPTQFDHVWSASMTHFLKAWSIRLLADHVQSWPQSKLHKCVQAFTRAHKFQSLLVCLNARLQFAGLSRKILTFSLIHFHLMHSVNQTVIIILRALILQLLLVRKLQNNWKGVIFSYSTEKEKYTYCLHLCFFYIHQFLPIANCEPKISFF